MGGSNFVTPAFVPDFANDGLLEAAVSLGASGTVVAASAGKRIAVFAVHLTAGAAGSFVVQDISTGGTVNANQTGSLAIAAGGQMVLPQIGYPWWTAAPGNALYFSFATACPIGGRIIYAQG